VLDIDTLLNRLQIIKIEYHSDWTFKIIQNITNATDDKAKFSAYIDFEILVGNF